MSSFPKKMDNQPTPGPSGTLRYNEAEDDNTNRSFELGSFRCSTPISDKERASKVVNYKGGLSEMYSEVGGSNALQSLQSVRKSFMPNRYSPYGKVPGNYTKSMFSKIISTETGNRALDELSSLSVLNSMEHSKVFGSSVDSVTGYIKRKEDVQNSSELSPNTSATARRIRDALASMSTPVVNAYRIRIDTIDSIKSVKPTSATNKPILAQDPLGRFSNPKELPKGPPTKFSSHTLPHASRAGPSGKKRSLFSPQQQSVHSYQLSQLLCPANKDPGSSSSLPREDFLQYADGGRLTSTSILPGQDFRRPMKYQKMTTSLVSASTNTDPKICGSIVSPNAQQQENSKLTSLDQNDNVTLLDKNTSKFKFEGKAWEAKKVLETANKLNEKLPTTSTSSSSVASPIVSKPSEDTSVNMSVFQKLAQSQKKSKWECPDCMVQNSMDKDACVCCGAINPSNKGAKSTQPQVATFPKATSSPAPAPAPAPSAFSSSFGQTSSDSSKKKWECPTCMVFNKPEDNSCVCCETANPNAPASSSDKVDSLKSEPKIPKPQFNFGFVASKSTAENKINTNFKFGETPKQDPVSSGPAPPVKFGFSSQNSKGSSPSEDDKEESHKDKKIFTPESNSVFQPKALNGPFSLSTKLEERWHCDACSHLNAMTSDKCESCKICTKPKTFAPFSLPTSSTSSSGAAEVKSPKENKYKFDQFFAGRTEAGKSPLAKISSSAEPLMKSEGSPVGSSSVFGMPKMPSSSPNLSNPLGTSSTSTNSFLPTTESDKNSSIFGGFNKSPLKFNAPAPLNTEPTSKVAATSTSTPSSTFKFGAPLKATENADSSKLFSFDNSRSSSEAKGPNFSGGDSLKRKIGSGDSNGPVDNDNFGAKKLFCSSNSSSSTMFSGAKEATSFPGVDKGLTTSTPGVSNSFMSSGALSKNPSTMFGAGGMSSGSTFGAPPVGATEANKPASVFRSDSSSSTGANSPGLFAFGAQAGQPTETTQGFQFNAGSNANANANAPSPGGFNFKMPSSSQNPSFSQPPGGSSGSLGSFGGPPSFNFGSIPANPSQPFQFSAGGVGEVATKDRKIRRAYRRMR